MHRYAIILLAGSLMLGLLPAHAGDGLVRLESRADVATTTQRLVDALNAKGMNVFATIDHATGATKAGMTLRPTTLVIFGNPKIGTQLMHCAQATGIDLPLKMLVWQDEGGQVWVAYNDPAWLQQRHAINGCDPVLAKVSQALANFAAAASGG